jgi:hypothetical protein
MRIDMDERLLGD